MTGIPIRKLTYVRLSELKSDARNARKHDRAQIRAIAKSIGSFGFNAPILVDAKRQVIAGHGRLEAARMLALQEVPIISLDDLSEAKARAYQIADNKLTDRSVWNEEQLAINLKELAELVLDFDLEDTGFETPEIDLLIQGLDEDPEGADRADEFQKEQGIAVSRLGDLWCLGRHRLLCGSALDSNAYATLMDGEKAAAVFTDPPYNVKIAGNVSGLGAITHREFAMASGEMSEAEFTNFLKTALGQAAGHTRAGGLVYSCMDWRHLGELLTAGRTSQLDLLNVCVWVKTNGGMGTLYRSQHEMIFVFRNGKTGHQNNVQLGRFGRNRTNVWAYPGGTAFGPGGAGRKLDLHPTVKPLALVSDAIMDCTSRNDIVLDPFVGSGTTILAAERTGRRGYGMELDPLYVDTAILRWQRITGGQAKLQSGETFQAVKTERSAPHERQ